MLFQQTTAPSGWTKDTTNYNNHALRVVTGTVGNGFCDFQLLLLVKVFQVLLVTLFQAALQAIPYDCRNAVSQSHRCRAAEEDFNPTTGRPRSRRLASVTQEAVVGISITIDH